LRPAGTRLVSKSFKIFPAARASSMIDDQNAGSKSNVAGKARRHGRKIKSAKWQTMAAKPAQKPR
jgi:hypothetical protein